MLLLNQRVSPLRLITHPLDVNLDHNTCMQHMLGCSYYDFCDTSVEVKHWRIKYLARRHFSGLDVYCLGGIWTLMRIKTDFGNTPTPFSPISVSDTDNCCHPGCHLTTSRQLLLCSDSASLLSGLKLQIGAHAVCRRIRINTHGSVSRQSAHHTLGHTWLLQAERLRPL